MTNRDLNLLVALDALLKEQSVIGAAHRLGLSASAMSRTLTRLREATGDPLLVRAGRGLVPTPHALFLREHVGQITAEARQILSPSVRNFSPATLEREFVLRTNEGFLEAYAVELVRRFMAEAPHVRLVFLPRRSKEAGAMREGEVDLEIGVMGALDFGPEMRVRALFHDRFFGAARRGHPVFDTPLTPERYASYRHVVTSRHGTGHGPVDKALAEYGLTRDIAVVVPAFDDALRLAADTDLLALVPGSCLGRGTDLQAFPLPVETAGITVSALWHPRLAADPAHRWFREKLLETCRTIQPDISRGPVTGICPTGAGSMIG